MSKSFARFYASVCRAFFYGNIFLSVLVIALSIETAFQLRLPLANSYYYLTMAVGVYLYYSYAYTRYVASYDSRGKWFKYFQKSIRQSQYLALALLCVFSFGWIFDWLGIWLRFSWIVQVFSLTFPFLGFAYYGSHLSSGFFNLRKRGWIKPFIIGYVWAGVVSIYPQLYLGFSDSPTLSSYSTISYFFYCWSFFTVNAILFDIKDQKIDSYYALPTFIVQLGVSKTVMRIIWPLLGLSVSNLLFFAYWQQFTPIRLICNLVPFLLLISIICTLKSKQKAVLYYLIVIDGLLLVKALLGILGVFLS